VTFNAGNSGILIPMRFKTVTAILLLCASAAVAQNSMSDTLRKGILAEDEQQNPGAAIQQYQAVLNQFADERQMAATALFRMAECYRKEGKKPQAIAAYQRILKDFADQTKLAQQSRTILATIYSIALAGSPQSQSPPDPKITAARARYRATLEEEESLAEKQLALERQRENAGAEGAYRRTAIEQKIQELKHELAAFDAGMTPSGRDRRKSQ